MDLAEFHAPCLEDLKILKSEGTPSFGEHRDSLPPLHGGWTRDEGALKVKALLVKKKSGSGFSMQPSWGFRDLQLEISRRFNIDDNTRVGIRYVDNNGESVLLTCDADLEEGKEIYRPSHSQTIRLFFEWIYQQTLGSSFGSSNPSWNHHTCYFRELITYFQNFFCLGIVEEEINDIVEEINRTY